MSLVKRLGKLAFHLVKISVVLAFVFVVLTGRNNKSEEEVEISGAKNWNNLNNNVVQGLTGQEMADYLQWSNSSSCRLANDFGGVMMLFGIDGQKAVCLDTEVRPIKGKCLVYSFGVNNEWSFEDAMDQYGCDVYAFDPSMNKSDHDRGDKIHFFRYGLGGRNILRREKTEPAVWRLLPLANFYRAMELRHGHGRIIDYLKIDIEKDEWEALPQILQSGMMDRVRQLGVEIHLPGNGSVAEFRRLIGIVRSLENYGMIRFDSKLNPFSEQWMEPLNLDSYSAYELAWYNGRLRRNRSFYYD